MPTPDPEVHRRALLAQLAQLSCIERGTLQEEYREQISGEGSERVRRGPYFKHQCWENGRNRSTRVPPEQVAQVREDLENGQRFDQLTSELATLAIEKSRARRASLSADPTAEEMIGKKNSRSNASKKDTGKQKPC